MMKILPALLVAVAMLSGCGGGGAPTVVTSAPAVAGDAGAAAPPVIGGTPATSVTAGTQYSFQPTASDANGDAISYSITNQPVWATFSTTSGLLSGIPSVAQKGSYSGIVISVIAGGANASLPTFSINVVAPPATGPATLTWAAPTLNTDGKTLSDLSGFNIYYGTSPTSLTQKVSIDSPSTTSYTVSNLTSGTWYFGVTAYDSAGDESALSNTGAAVIP